MSFLNTNERITELFKEIVVKAELYNPLLNGGLKLAIGQMEDAC